MPPQLLHTRTAPPWSRRSWPTRDGSPQLGQITRRFDTWIGASRSRMPPWIPFWGLGRVCDHVDPLDDRLLLRRQHPQDLAPGAPVPPGGDQDLVVSLHVELLHHSTSGASDTIFMNRRSRSSRATGPKTRVPTGSPSSLISTAELVSNRM